jgi:hypothetical protein
MGSGGGNYEDWPRVRGECRFSLALQVGWTALVTAEHGQTKKESSQSLPSCSSSMALHVITPAMLRSIATTQPQSRQPDPSIGLGRKMLFHMQVVIGS